MARDRDVAANAGVPMEALRPIFILACSFRSGSTFLQRLVNSTEDAFIWGENVGLSEELMAAVAKLRSWRAISAQQRGMLEADGCRAWVANLTPDTDELDAARAFFLQLYAHPTRQRGIARWGFKEVRHDAAIAAFLLETFPLARIVFLVRRPEDVLASMATSAWYAEAGGAEGVMAQWRRAASSFADFVDPRTLLLRLEDARTPATLSHLARHIEIAPERFDAGLLAYPVRGSLALPALGRDERAALDGADLDRLRERLGY